MTEILSIALTRIAACLDFIFQLMASLFASTERKTEFNADFMPAGKLLSSWNKGWCLNGRQCLTAHDSMQHAIIFGFSGGYKTTGICIPSILKMRGNASFIITDPSGEMMSKVSGALLRSAYKLKSINYSSAMTSEGYNPILRATSEAMIKKVSSMIVRQVMGTGRGDPFWNISAVELISLAIKYLAHEQPAEYRTLYNAYKIISMMALPDVADLMFVRCQNKSLLDEYKVFVSYGSKTLASIIATARAALAMFATDNEIALITSHDSIDFFDFQKRPTALFINTNVTDLAYCSSITSIFLEQLFAHVMKVVPSKNAIPLFILLEEASSLHFPSLPVTISNLRKYHVSLCQIYQSTAQLIDNYGPSGAKTILENSFSKVYMQGVPTTVAQELEITLGKFEYLDSNGTKHLRSLATAAEIHQLDESLILCGNYPAIKTTITPYFEQLSLRKLTTVPPYSPSRTIPFDVPPLMPFPTS